MAGNIDPLIHSVEPPPVPPKPKPLPPPKPHIRVNRTRRATEVLSKVSKIELEEKRIVENGRNALATRDSNEGGDIWKYRDLNLKERVVEVNREPECPPCCPCVCHFQRHNRSDKERQEAKLEEEANKFDSLLDNANMENRITPKSPFNEKYPKALERHSHGNKNILLDLEYWQMKQQFEGGTDTRSAEVSPSHLGRPLPKEPDWPLTAANPAKDIPDCLEGIYMEIEDMGADGVAFVQSELNSALPAKSKETEQFREDYSPSNISKPLIPVPLLAAKPFHQDPSYGVNSKKQEIAKKENKENVYQKSDLDSTTHNSVLVELKERFPGVHLDHQKTSNKGKKFTGINKKVSRKLSLLTCESLASFIGGKRSPTDDVILTSPSRNKKTKSPVGFMKDGLFLDSGKDECSNTKTMTHLSIREDNTRNDIFMASPVQKKKDRHQCVEAEDLTCQPHQILHLEEELKDSQCSNSSVVEISELSLSSKWIKEKKNLPKTERVIVGTINDCCPSEGNGDDDDDDLSPNFVIRRQPGKKRPLQQYWQNRSVVQDSGVLDHLDKQKLLLQESMYEVVTSEQSYLDSLTVAVDHFMHSPDLDTALGPRDRKSLFSSIGKIKEISSLFLEDLKEKLEGNLFCDICDVILHHARNNFSAYVDYIRNMLYQEQTLHNLSKENPQFVEILSHLQQDPKCNRLPLKSFLVLPFQRITRIKILVEAILKRMDPGSEGGISAEKALKEISKIVEDCNREVGRMKQMEELVHIANKIEFACKGLPLVSSSRWLVKQGEVIERTDKENIFGQKKNSPVYLFLFNDLLLVTIRKGVDRFVVLDHAHRSLIEISDSAEDDLNTDKENTFLLVLLKNHRNVTSQRLLKAGTEVEKNNWIEALSPRKSDGIEVYEEWDCPQVQCTVAYAAQQPGELSLDPDDILNVIQKTSDGWLEGRRLVDGERGWFPHSYVKEITNEHVQRRHLRQRYHVLQTASKLLNLRNSSRERFVSTSFK
ncbi:uncharacterized protein LOC114646568 isoform X2 [Erpetoichthys calabaricus]|uniref:uncharacterized protein LOC114646568 isoform X2 n=1 Tax=Erpetoichthys calabaricus TaxID=27687 RepID=UPI0022344035|nr:uncharacterized protein LOC114646568 isoform X2 [Erpetoichthys calabaricus]